MKKAILLLSVASVLTGCLVTRNEAETIQQKKALQENVVHLQKSTADQQSRFNDINNEIRDLNGKIEVLENKLTLMQQDREKLRKENEESLAAANKRINALQEEVIKLEGQINQLGAAAVEENPATKNYLEEAEDYYVKKDWKKAIFSFQKFRETSPKHKKVPEATLKIGISFHELGMKDEAKTFLEEVISKHPGSPSAKVAKNRLKKIK